MKTSKYVITGSSSGLGKYLRRNLGGIGWSRQTSEKEKEEIKKNGAEIIIHCAFNSKREPKNLDQYFNDNVLFTGELVKVPHEKFIFISSVDIYPKDGKKHFENEVIKKSKIDGLYGVTKFLSEQVIKKNCSNFLILRCSSLLGRDSRENSLIKTIKQDYPVLTLSAKSIFNYILHKNVLEFINLAIKKDLQGIYNIASSENISLKEIASLLKKEVTYGKYVYNVGDIDNTKAVTYLPSLKKTSKEVVIKFISMYESR